MEIDESQCGKRKHHKGHHVDGCWVLGGVEETKERKAFMCEVKKRDAATLLAVIKKCVLPGSIVLTD